MYLFVIVIREQELTPANDRTDLFVQHTIAYRVINVVAIDVFPSVDVNLTARCRYLYWYLHAPLRAECVRDWVSDSISECACKGMAHE